MTAGYIGSLVYAHAGPPIIKTAAKNTSVFTSQGSSPFNALSAGWNFGDGLHWSNPVGLSAAAGDTAFLTLLSGSLSETLTAPTGFTLIASGSGGVCKIWVYARVLTAADLAGGAPTYTWTFNGAGYIDYGEGMEVVRNAPLAALAVGGFAYHSGTSVTTAGGLTTPGSYQVLSIGAATNISSSPGSGTMSAWSPSSSVLYRLSGSTNRSLAMSVLTGQSGSSPAITGAGATTSGTLTTGDYFAVDLLFPN